MKFTLQFTLIFFIIFNIVISTSVQNNQENVNHQEQIKIENSPVFKHKPLYFYRKFMKDHNKVNKNVPVKQHYANERNLRVQKNKLMNQIDALNRRVTFMKRDTEH